MAPKKTTPKSTRASGTPADTSIPLSTPRLELPGLIRPAGPDATPSGPQHSTQLTSSEALPGLLIRDLTPAVRESASSDSQLPADNIRDYALLPQERTLLPAVMTQGLRIYRGRIYAEVQYTSTGTVMVGWDDGAGTYRATRSKEAHPPRPGPAFRLSKQHLASWRATRNRSSDRVCGPSTGSQPAGHSTTGTCARYTIKHASGLHRHPALLVGQHHDSPPWLRGHGPENAAGRFRRTSVASCLP